MLSKKRSGPLALHELLAAHNKFAGKKNTFAEVLGDGYMYANSEIYRSIREAFLALGYQYKSDPSFPYISCPLLALVEMLEQKIVPYVDNTFFLSELETLRPKIFRVKEFERIGLVGNYLLHESAHCIAHHILGGPPSLQESLGASSEKPDVLKIMLAESFANSVEFMTASFLGHSSIEKWMTKNNLYFFIQRSNMRTLSKQVGTNLTFKILMLIFLYSNFLGISMYAAGEEKIFNALGLDKKLRKNRAFRKNLKQIEKDAFTLDVSFRLTTGSLYFKRLGFKKSLFNLLSFDPLDLILQSPELSQKIDQLAEVIDGSYLRSNQVSKDQSAA